MPTDASVELIQRELEAGNRQDVDAWAACHSADATNHGRPAGREGLRGIFRSLVMAFPDLHFELGEVVAESSGRWWPTGSTSCARRSSPAPTWARPTCRSSAACSLASRVNQPVLAMLGAQSSTVAPFTGHRQEALLAWLPNAEAFVLRGATHLLHVQNPRGKAEALAAFLARHPLAPPS